MPAQDLVALVEKLNALFAEGRTSEVARHLHPEADVQSFSARGGVMRGPEHASSTMARATHEWQYRFRFDSVTQLDDASVLAVGTVAYLADDNVTMTHSAAWLWTFEGGLLRWGRVFTNDDEARRAWRRGDLRPPADATS